MENLELDLNELGKVTGGTEIEYGPAGKAYIEFYKQILAEYGPRPYLEQLSSEDYEKWQKLRQAFIEEGVPSIVSEMDE